MSQRSSGTMDKIRAFLGGDWTPLEHCLWAAAIQLAFLGVCRLVGFPMQFCIGAGMGAAICFFTGREHAQQQDFSPRPLGDIEAMMMWRWDRGSAMDLICPCVSTAVTTAAMLSMCE